MDIAVILSHSFPEAHWMLSGNDYAGLDWLDETPKPTEKALEALWAEVQDEVAREQVEQARAQAYRETSDPIFFEYQRGDKTEAEWLAAVQAVKDAHPYPEQV
jgi:predicted phosphoribosyltransferase